MTLSLVPRPPKVSIPKTVPVTTGGGTVASVTTITALPDTVNLNLYAGDDFSMTLALTNPDGSNTSLVGATVLAQIRSQPGSSIIAIFTPTISGNVITLSLAGTLTQNLSGKYDWDCQVSNLTGTGTWTIVAGDVSFTQDITR